MRGAPERIDFALYAQAFPVYARNLAILLPIFVAMLIVVGIDLLSGWLWSGVGGAGAPLTGLVANLVQGFGFAVALVAADDAWRHGRANVRSAWEQAKRRPGDILISILGFAFVVYVAGLIGGVVAVPYLGLLLQLIAVWAFLYAVPAATLGGTPGGASLSASLQTSRRHPIATIVLMVVSIVVYWGLAIAALDAIAPYVAPYAFEAVKFLLSSLALGYIATVMARQFTGFAFRPFW